MCYESATDSAIGAGIHRAMLTRDWRTVMELTDSQLIESGAWCIAGMIVLCVIALAAMMHYATRD